MLDNNEQPMDSEEGEDARNTERDIAVLEKLGQTLAAKRQKAIDARVAQGIDERWFNDVEAYEGRDEVTRHYAGLRAQVQGYLASLDTKTQKRSTLIVNVTRSKVNTASARLQDIALPTDDRNWDLRHSTVPELVAQMSQKHIGLTKNGQPVMVNDNGVQRQATMADMANRDAEKAKKCAEAMRSEIDDQLDMSNDGCGYEGVLRQVMDDESLLGVGIAKGPIVRSRVKKVWMPLSDGQKTVHVLQRIQDMKPGSSRVNPWDIYPHPECGENPNKFPIWERIPGVTAADIRNYADIPGYLPEQIKKVLIEGPRKPDQPPDKPGVMPVTTEETIYECWEYHGELGRDELEAAGGKCSDDDVFTTYSATVIMINETVIKADIEILDTGDMPYDFFVTNKSSGSWAGFGTAFLSRSAQRAITAGWRAMMDNAGQFVGPQIVMHRKNIAPADGKWELRGMKLWFYLGSDDAADMGKMFAVHEISAHQAEYANIIKMGMEFLDNETALPQLAQGEQGQATDVLGGMNLLLNASNVLMRRKLKSLDDQLTIRHIGRYVDWNMQYNPKSEIKGDFEVQARASGALMDMEIQNKSAGNLLALATNPNFAAGMKKWEAVRRVVRAFRFDPKDFVEDDDTIKRNEENMAKNQTGDPRIEVAKIRAEADAKIEQQRIAFEEKDNERQRQNDIAIKMIDKELQSTELSSVERQVLEKIKAELAGVALKLSTQEKLSGADIAHNKDIALSQHKVELHKHRNPAPVLTPPTEPVGKAAPGKAFAQ